MNEFILKELNEEKVVYLYYPNGHKEFGEIEYIFSEKQVHVVKRGTIDDTGRFAHKAKRQIQRCAKENNFPEKMIQAWY